MIRRSLAVFILCGSVVTIAFAQAVAPEGRAESRVFSFSMGDGGYLGVETADVSRDNYAKFGLREVRGVAVEKVMEGSPAATAGLQAGDVIIKFNGEDVASVRKLTRLISEVAPDHKVKVTILRSGDEREITATLGKREIPSHAVVGTSGAPGRIRIPEFPDLPAIPPGEMRVMPFPRTGDGEFSTLFGGFGGRQIGVSVTPLTKQLADHFNVPSGVMINNVRENSPAAKAGLKAGDIIVEAEGSEVKRDFDLIRAIDARKDGDVQLTVVRNGSRQTLRVTPEARPASPETYIYPQQPLPPASRPTRFFTAPRGFLLSPFRKRMPRIR